MVAVADPSDTMRPQPLLLQRTFLLYGLPGLCLAVAGALIQLLGLSSDLTPMLVVLPLVTIFLALAMSTDATGLLCVALGWIPFSLDILQVHVSIATISPYSLVMMGLVPIAAWRMSKSRTQIKFDTQARLVAMLCLSYMISTFTSSYPVVETGHFAFHAIFVPVVGYFVIKNMIRTKAEYVKCVLFLIAGIVFYALFGFLAFHPTPGDDRLMVLKVPPISAATMFSVAIVYLVAIPWPKAKYRWSATALSFVGLVATLSRGYLVLLIVAPVIWRWIRKGKAFAVMCLFMVLTLIFTLILSFNANSLAPSTVINWHEERTYHRLLDAVYWESSIYRRAEYWMEGLEDFVKHPIFGTGIFRGDQAVVRHNFHLEWLEYGGLCGYILWLSLFLHHYRRFGRLARKDRYVAANLLIIQLILANGVTNPLTVGVMPVFAFLVMGLNEARRRQYVGEEVPWVSGNEEMATTKEIVVRR